MSNLGRNLAGPEWQPCARIVRAVAEAASAEELDRLEPGFRRAYRELWDTAWRSKRRSPSSKVPSRPGEEKGILRDEELEDAIVGILNAEALNPLYRDAQAGTLAHEVRHQIRQLVAFTVYFYKRP